MRTLRTVLRWGVAIACFFLATWLGRTGYETLDPTRLAGGGLAFVVGAALIWVDIFRIATRPFMLLIDSIFSPGGHFRKPALSWKLADFYLAEQRHAEALEEFRSIIRHYPDEARAYEGAIDLLVNEFDRRGEARKLFHRSQRRGLELAPRIGGYFSPE